jgi:hypothetical protein
MADMPEEIDDILAEIERQKTAARKAKATRAGAGRPKGRKDIRQRKRKRKIQSVKNRALVEAREAEVGPKPRPAKMVPYDAANDVGDKPLDIMLARMRELWNHGSADDADKARAVAIAKDAAPYVHPRLNAVNHSGNVTNSLDGFSSAELSLLHQHLIALEAEGSDSSYDPDEGEEGLRGVADPFLEDGVA